MPFVVTFKLNRIKQWHIQRDKNTMPWEDALQQTVKVEPSIDSA